MDAGAAGAEVGVVPLALVEGAVVGVVEVDVVVGAACSILPSSRVTHYKNKLRTRGNETHRRVFVAHAHALNAMAIE